MRCGSADAETQLCPDVMASSRDFRFYPDSGDLIGGSRDYPFFMDRRTCSTGQSLLASITRTREPSV
jgi:hypothetical protein